MFKKSLAWVLTLALLISALSGLTIMTASADTVSADRVSLKALVAADNTKIADAGFTSVAGKNGLVEAGSFVAGVMFHKAYKEGAADLRISGLTGQVGVAFTLDITDFVAVNGNDVAIFARASSTNSNKFGWGSNSNLTATTAAFTWYKTELADAPSQVDFYVQSWGWHAFFLTDIYVCKATDVANVEAWFNLPALIDSAKNMPTSDNLVAALAAAETAAAADMTAIPSNTVALYTALEEAVAQSGGLALQNLLTEAESLTAGVWADKLDAAKVNALNAAISAGEAALESGVGLDAAIADLEAAISAVYGGKYETISFAGLVTDATKGAVSNFASTVVEGQNGLVDATGFRADGYNLQPGYIRPHQGTGDSGYNVNWFTLDLVDFIAANGSAVNVYIKAHCATNWANHNLSVGSGNGVNGNNQIYLNPASTTEISGKYVGYMVPNSTWGWNKFSFDNVGTYGNKLIVSGTSLGHTSVEIAEIVICAKADAAMMEAKLYAASTGKTATVNTAYANLKTNATAVIDTNGRVGGEVGKAFLADKAVVDAKADADILPVYMQMVADADFTAQIAVDVAEGITKDDFTLNGENVSAEYIDVDEDGLLLYKICNISPDNMGMEFTVTATPTDAEQKGYTITGSMKSYAEALYAEEVTKELGRTLLNLGAYTESFSGAASTINEALAEADKAVADISGLTPNHAFGNEEFDVTFDKVKVVVADAIRLQFTIANAPEGAQLYADGIMEAYDIVNGVAKVPVAAASLKAQETYMVIDAEGNPLSNTLTYGVLDYCAQIGEGEATDAVKNLCGALVDYANAL